MATKKATKPVTKSGFLRRVLSRNPNLDYQQVLRRWAKAGHDGTISNPLYYKVRAELGIYTEWVWVREGGPEPIESQRPEPERENHPNVDLVEAAEFFLPQILRFYKLFEDKRPVMLLELPSQKIYAYPYKEFKDDLNERSQAILKDQYEQAIAENKVVFVRDNEARSSSIQPNRRIWPIPPS
jgi:hypothetical protein